MKRKLSKQALFCFCLLTAPMFAFTYQGRLYDDGDPLQGNYDMYFTLYDASQAGNAVTAAFNMPAISVVNGYFTANIAFPASELIYNGQARWLQVSMRKSGTADPLTTLSPRCSMAAVPYAHQAQTAQQLQPLSFITDHIVKMEIEGEPDRYFHYFSGLEQTVTVLLNQTTKMPGMPKIKDIELRVFADEDISFYNWIQQCKTTLARKTIRLSVLDRKGVIREQWLFEYCLPRRLQYDYDPALAAVVRTVVFSAQRASRPAEAIGRTANEWYPGPQPRIKGPFVFAPQDMPEQTFDSFGSLGLLATVVTTPPPDPFPVESIVVSSLDPVFVRNAQNNPYMAEWFDGVVTGNWEYRRVRFSLVADGHSLIDGDLLQSWPFEVKSFFDPLSNKMKESIRLAVQETILD